MSFPNLMATLAIVYASIGAFLVYFIPWLWTILKPYIHAITA